MSLNISGRGALVAAGILAAISFAAPAFADPQDFVGDWHNVDHNTRDLKRVHIDTGPFGFDIHAYGACEPQACDWGGASGHLEGGDTLEAKYKTGFSTIWLTLHRDWHQKLDYKMHTHFTDNSGRADYDVTGELRSHEDNWYGPGGPGAGMGEPPPPPPGGGYGGPGGGMGAPPPPPPGGMGGPMLGNEDCISFDPGAVDAVYIGGDWQVVQGSMLLLDYGNNAAAAHRASYVIHHYHFDQQCFVRRPNASMMYWKNGPSVPVGGLSGQDCIGVNTANVQAQYAGGGWKVVDGNNWLLDYGNEHGAANKAVAVIQTYNLNRQCFVVRQSGSMQYWLAQ